ncbi:MAG: hypothetical protein WD181_05210 [Solirubrobacterales bacterium]
MDPEKTNSDSPGGRPSDRPTLEQRVEGLSRREREQESARNPDASKDRPASSDKAGTDSAKAPPRLTERQRIEAREQRHRRGRSQSGSGPGNPLSRGVRATLLEVRRTAGFFRALVLNGLNQLGPAIRWLTSGVLVVLRAVGNAISAVVRLLAGAASRLGGAVLRLDRLFTPRHALIVVAGAAFAALIASQFLDFRATEVGQAAYDPIQEITRAPRIDIQTPLDAHSVLLLVVGAVALAGLVGVAATGRRTFAGLISLAGFATIAITLLIDLPKGLDVEIAEISYSGVVAVLLSGFWTQLAAGFVLATGGLGLLALSGKRRRSRALGDRLRRDRRRRPRPLDVGSPT